MAYQMAAMAVTLNNLEDHIRIYAYRHCKTNYTDTEFLTCCIHTVFPS